MTNDGVIRNWPTHKIAESDSKMVTLNVDLSMEPFTSLNARVLSAQYEQTLPERSESNFTITAVKRFLLRLSIK